MKRITTIFVGLFVLSLAGCGQQIAHDLTTPEGAILTLEDAYRAQDIEAAVRCKDFDIEAKLMFQKLNKDWADESVIEMTAKVLELGYRSELKKTGFPDFTGVVSTFSDKKPFGGDGEIVRITETCRHSDGSKTTNYMVVAKTPDGWKVVSVPD